MTGLISLRCPECGRPYTMADLGVRPRPPWLAFARSGWGWLTLAAIFAALMAWMSSLHPPTSALLQVLFFQTHPGNGQLGVVNGVLHLLIVSWFVARISKKPRARARAGDVLLVAWGLMVFQVLGVLLSILL
jgi:hypothetical protein